ncbi:MAG TPA: metallophosphoesterase [Polyangia bacterium]|jgi:hypothetical protein
MSRARLGAAARTLALVVVAGAAPAAAAPPASAPGPLRVIILGDTRPKVHFEHAADARIAPAIFAAVAAERPVLAFHTGDYVERGSDPKRWERFAAALAPITAAGVRFYPVAGNHEYLDRLYQRSRNALGGYLRAFAFPARDARGHALPAPRPDARPPTGPRWYSVLERGALFIVLDTNAADDDGSFAKDVTPLADWDAQAAFLRHHLAWADRDPRVRHVLVLMHHPMYTRNSRHPSPRALWDFPLGSPEERRARSLKRSLDASRKLRAVLSGHNHNYERYVCERDGGGPVLYAVIGGGGAPATPLTHPPTGPRFGPLGALPNACVAVRDGYRQPHGIADAAPVYGFVRLEIDDAEVRYEMVPVGVKHPKPDRVRLTAPRGPDARVAAY